MNRSGLTLVELVVALTVGGAALAVGYGAFASIVDRRTAVRDATDTVARAGAARGAVSAWLAGARLVTDRNGPRFRGLDGVAGGFADDEITWLTTAATPLDAGETIVRLYIDRDDATPERGLVAEFGEWRGPATTRLEIEPAAQSLDVRYLTDVLGARRWLPSWISSTLLPAAVEVTIGSGAHDGLPPLLARSILVPVRGGT